jgi:hypothetical protein
MNYYDNPHRLPEDHVLNVASRQTNEETGILGLPTMLASLGLDVTPEGLAYFAEQRAIRAMAARAGHDLGADPANRALDEAIAQEIISSDSWQQMRMVLISAYMDGIAIGARAQALKTPEPFIPLDGDRRTIK